MRHLRLGLVLAFSTAASAAHGQSAQRPAIVRASSSKPPADTGQQLEIYGFGQADMIYDFKQNDPNWFDVNRPSRLPKVDDEFGFDHRTWFSARQSRFGVKGTYPTDHGDIKTQFEFDMFGVGVDAGQTTIRLRTAYGQWGQFGAGQLVSPFMDVDVFPNILDYWGPNGMLFFRNVQVFWQPINHDNTRMTFALERPGASGDAGIYADRVELKNIKPRFPAPDLSGEFRLGRKWGYVELAGIVRDIHWDDVLADTFDLSGHATGWGVSLSSNVNVTKHDVLRMQTVYGKAVENYFNDAPVDIGIENNFSDPHRPILGEPLPDLGLSFYLDHQWNSKWSSAIGWSGVNITNSDGQDSTAFHNGQYASVNALYTPVTHVMMGAEFQWAYRKNFSGNFTANDYRVQVSFKYSFAKTFGGN